MADPENIVECEDLSAGYPGRTVLEHVSFSVKRGEIFALLGGSGCGKSTIMKHIAGLNPPVAGRLRVSGIEMNAANRDRILAGIGVMFQSGALFGSMTLLENVMLPLEEFSPLPTELRTACALAKLELVGLREFAGFLPSAISGGMKKRAAIARAMALDPGLILLDEPSAGLDPVTSAALDDLVLKLREERGTTFIIVTHELPSVFKIADRCAIFDRDRRGMAACGVPAELRERRDDPFIEAYFNRGGTNGR